jgi:steroid delta-isomerase-like uncharacterized protein
MVHRDFPDVHLEIEDVFATDAGRAALRLTITGTQDGELLGVPPTGRRVSFTTINLYRIEDGRIAETWQMIDWAGALRQVGATPPSGR